MDPKRHFKRSGKSKALLNYFQVSNRINRPHLKFRFAQCVVKSFISSSVVVDVLNEQRTKSNV
jgi:hypothetical protein